MMNKQKNIQQSNSFLSDLQDHSISNSFHFNKSLRSNQSISSKDNGTPIITAKYSGLRVSAKNSSIKKRSSRKSGLSRLSASLTQKQSFQDVPLTKISKFAIAKSTTKFSRDKNIMNKDEYQENSIQLSQNIQNSKNNQNINHDTLTKQKNNIYTSQNSQKKQKINQNISIKPEGFNYTLYSQIFPLGSKSYGVIYENYYGLMIGNNEAIHINRNVFPKSSLLYANITVKKHIIFMQSLNIFKHAKKKDNIQKISKSESLNCEMPAGYDNRKRRTSIFGIEHKNNQNQNHNQNQNQNQNQSRSNQHKDESRNNFNYIKREGSKKRLQKLSQHILDSNNEKQELQINYFHINLAQYCLINKSVINTVDYCIQCATSNKRDENDENQNKTNKNKSMQKDIESHKYQFLLNAYQKNLHREGEDSIQQKSILQRNPDSQSTRYLKSIKRVSMVAERCTKLDEDEKSICDSFLDDASFSQSLFSQNQMNSRERKIRKMTSIQNKIKPKIRRVRSSIQKNEKIQVQKIKQSQQWMEESEASSLRIKSQDQNQNQNEKENENENQNQNQDEIINDSQVSIQHHFKDKKKKTQKNRSFESGAKRRGKLTKRNSREQNKIKKNLKQKKTVSYKLDQNSQVIIPKIKSIAQIKPKKIRKRSSITQRKQSLISLKLKLQQKINRSASQQKIMEEQTDLPHTKSLIIVVEHVNDERINKQVDEFQAFSKSITIYQVDVQNLSLSRFNQNKNDQANKQQLYQQEKTKQPVYYLINPEFYSQYLRDSQKLVSKNCLIEKQKKIFLVTNQTVYHISTKKVQTQRKNSNQIVSVNFENRRKKSLKKQNEIGQGNESQKNINISCKNMKVLQKIIEYEASRQANIQQQKQNESGINKEDNGQNYNNEINKELNRRKSSKIAVSILNKFLISGGHNSIEIINCCWFEYNHFMVLASNNLLYEIQENKVINCQDIMSTVKNNTQSNKTKKEDLQNQQTGKLNHKKYFIGQMVKVLQIDSVRGSLKSTGLIIARIQVVTDIITHPTTISNQNQINKQSIISQNIEYMMQNQFFVFKYNKRWTQFYSKLQNFINQKIMNSGISLKIQSNQLQQLQQNIKIKQGNSQTMIQKFNIDPEVIKIKIIDRQNTISEEYLDKAENNQNNRRINTDDINQFYIFCQWGLMIGEDNQFQSSAVSGFNERSQVYMKNQKKINDKNIKKFSQIYKKYQENYKKRQNSKKKVIKNSNNRGTWRNQNNLQMFIVQVNILGKYLKNTQQINPLCIRLQQYYNTNIKNIYQIRYKPDFYHLQTLKTNNLYRKIKRYEQPQKNLSSFYSTSANNFNIVILSKQGNRRILNMYQRNFMLRIKPQHYMHVGLSTKTFIQNFRHTFTYPFSASCICIDNFAVNLIVAVREKIIMYYILKDRIVKGVEINLQGIVNMKYDRYNWHLYAYNSNVLYIINPYDFQIQRELIFEGQIINVQIGNDFVFVKWKERISQAIYLAVFPLYEVISDDFKTYETELDTYVPKNQVEQYLKICQIENLQKKSLSIVRRKSIFFQSNRNGKDNIKDFELLYCFDTDAENNTLFIINQFYIEIHKMNFSSVEQRKSQNEIQKKQSDKQVQKKQSNNNLKRRISIISRKSSSMFLQSINNLGSQKSKISQTESQQSISNNSNYQNTNTQKQTKLSQLLKQCQLEQVSRIRISFKLSNSQIKLRQGQKQIKTSLIQYPSSLKFDKKLSTLIIGTNKGRIALYQYQNHMQIDAASIAYPFYSQKVSQSKIQQILISRNVLYNNIYIINQNQSIMSFRIIQANKKVEKTYSNNHILDSQFNTNSNKSITDKKQQKLYNFNLYFPTIDCKIQSQEFSFKKIENNTQKMKKQLEKSKYRKWKQSGPKNQFQFNLRYENYLGEHEIHSQLSNNYRLYSSNTIEKLSQQIQQLQLRLLKIRGDKQQLFLKNKKKFDEQIAERQRKLFDAKVYGKLQEKKVFLAGKNSLAHLQKFNISQQNYLETQLKQQLKKQYTKIIGGYYKQYDRLKNVYEEIQRKNKKQKQELKKINDNQTQILKDKYGIHINNLQISIKELQNKMQVSKKIQQIEMQQTEQQYKALKGKQNDKFDDIIQTQLQKQNFNNYKKWSCLQDIKQMRDKINQLQELSRFFVSDISNWKNNMESKMQFNISCQHDCSKLEKQLQKKQRKYNFLSKIQAEEKKNIRIKKQNSFYELNHFINFAKQEIQQKQNQKQEMQTQQKEMQQKINNTILNIQKIEQQSYKRKIALDEKNRYMCALKEKKKMLNDRCLILKSKINRIQTTTYQFMTDCLDEIYQDEQANKKNPQKIKNQISSKSNKKIQNNKLKLKLDRPSKFDRSYLKFMNKEILNLQLKNYDSPNKKVLNIKEEIEINQNNNNQNQNKIEYMQFLKFVQLTNDRKNKSKIKDNLMKKQDDLKNIIEYKQAFNQNKELLSNLNILRQKSFDLHAKEKKLKIYLQQFRLLFNELHNPLKDQKEKQQKKRVVFQDKIIKNQKINQDMGFEREFGKKILSLPKLIIPETKNKKSNKQRRSLSTYSNYSKDKEKKSENGSSKNKQWDEIKMIKNIIDKYKKNQANQFRNQRIIASLTTQKSISQKNLEPRIKIQHLHHRENRFSQFKNQRKLSLLSHLNGQKNRNKIYSSVNLKKQVNIGNWNQGYEEERYQENDEQSFLKQKAKGLTKIQQEQQTKRKDIMLKSSSQQMHIIEKNINKNIQKQIGPVNEKRIRL